MLLIGLTGGVGMGKSTVANFLARRGEPLIDTDELARELVEPGQTALGEIAVAFGDSVMRRDGTLDRTALARVVFADPEQRRILESILHPRIRETWKSRAQKWAGDGIKHGVVIIPLLFETAAEKELDMTICVACARRTQEERLVSRGWAREEVAKRIAAQMPIAEKMDRSDRVVWNESTLKVCEEQVDRIFNGIDQL